jgi:hypothetical protein
VNDPVIMDAAEIRARKTLEQLERTVRGPQRGPRPTPVPKSKAKRKRLIVRASRRRNRV